MKRNVEPIVPTPAVGARANDSELVSRALLGEDWAREALFRNHVSAVTATVLRLSSRSEDAEDIVQDAFVAAFTELDRLRDHSAFRAWLLSIAVRKLHRRFRRRKFMQLLGLDHGINDSTLVELTDAAATPEMRAELALLDRALSRLPAQERIAWVLRHVEGEGLDEIASILGCSLATTKRRIKGAEEKIAHHTRVKEQRHG